MLTVSETLPGQQVPQHHALVKTDKPFAAVTRPLAQLNHERTVQRGCVEPQLQL